MVLGLDKAKKSPASLDPDPSHRSRFKPDDDEGDLVSIASLSPSEAVALWQYLKSEGISGELLHSTDEGGIQRCDVLVPEEYFQNASWLAEAWEEGCAKQNRLIRRCPACSSPDCSRVSHERLGEIGKCSNCGCEFELR